MSYSMHPLLTRSFCFIAIGFLGVVSTAQETATDKPDPAFAAAPADDNEFATAPMETKEMETIFNGVDLTGWSGDDRLWTVKDGAIRGETTAENKAKGNTFLIWEDGSTADFELRLSFRVSTENNSGIQYRSDHIVDETKKPKNKFVLRGYQFEIRNSDTYPLVSGFIYDEGGSRKFICMCGEKATWDDGKKQVEGTLVTDDEYQKLFNVDQWNEIVIIAKGRRIQHFMNDRLILDFTDSEDDARVDGKLGLQLHAGKPMWVEFKDVRFKELK